MIIIKIILQKFLRNVDKNKNLGCWELLFLPLQFNVWIELYFFLSNLQKIQCFLLFFAGKNCFFFIKMKDGISYFKDPHILTQNNDLKHVFWCLSANSCYKNGYKKAQYIVSMQIFIIIIIGSFKKSLDFFKASYILISLHFYNS